MVSPPPGMPPMDPGMMPPMGPPMPPPEPPPPPLPPTSPADSILLMLRAAIESEGIEAARERVLTLPPQMIEAVWELAETSPELAAILEELLPSEPEGPDYPAWLARQGPPPKPSQAALLDLAGDDERYYAEYREQVRINLAYYHAPGTRELYSTFKNFNHEKEEPYISSALTDEVNAIMAQLGDASLTFQLPYLDPALENDTQRIEDALYSWEEEEERRYVAAGNNPYRRDVAWYLLICGMVAWRTGLNPEDPDHPFDDALLNPTTVYPMWDRRGLSRVTRRYGDTVAGVIADYDLGDGKVRTKILNATKTSGLKVGERDRLYRQNDRVRVTTYHDRWWYAVFVDDLCIIEPTAHRYGFVPYVIQKSGLGEPMPMQDVTGRNSVGTSLGDDLRMGYKFPSHFQYRKAGHQQAEAVATKMYNLFAVIDKPDFWLLQDEVAEAAKLPSVKTGGGGNNMNPLKMNHEQPVPIVASPNAGFVIQPMMAMIGADRQTGSLPLASYGVFESANQSGNATEGAVEAGGDKRAPHIQALEAFYAAKQEMRATIWRDWGHLVESRDGAYGEMRIPTQRKRRIFNPALGPSFTLTPETIKRTGTRVTAELTHLRLQNLAPMGNAWAMWMQMNAASAREAMESRGVRDPDAIFLEREYEQALLDPALQQARRLQLLRARDPEAAQLYEQLIQQKQQPAPPPGAGMMPGAPPGMAPPMAPNTSGMNLQALGMGQQGPTGRPPGGGPPPPPPGSVVIPPGGM